MTRKRVSYGHFHQTIQALSLFSLFSSYKKNVMMNSVTVCPTLRYVVAEDRSGVYPIRLPGTTQHLLKTRHGEAMLQGVEGTRRRERQTQSICQPPGAAFLTAACSHTEMVIDRW